MVAVQIDSSLCFFGRDGEFRWESEDKQLEQLLNKHFIYYSPPYEPDPFLYSVKRAQRLINLTILTITKPEITRIPDKHVVV